MLTVITFLYDPRFLPRHIGGYGLVGTEMFKLNYSSIESSLKIADATGGTFFYNSLN